MSLATTNMTSPKNPKIHNGSLAHPNKTVKKTNITHNTGNINPSLNDDFKEHDSKIMDLLGDLLGP